MCICFFGALTRRVGALQISIIIIIIIKCQSYVCGAVFLTAHFHNQSIHSIWISNACRSRTLLRTLRLCHLVHVDFISQFVVHVWHPRDLTWLNTVLVSWHWKRVSLWYNRNGWLGANHQTYLLTYSVLNWRLLRGHRLEISRPGLTPKTLS